MKTCLKLLPPTIIVLCFLLFCTADNNNKIYFSISSSTESVFSEPIVIRANGEPIGVLKRKNSSFIIEITQFLVKGENIIEINTNIDLEVNIFSDTSELPITKNIDKTTIIKFNIEYEVSSILKYAEDLKHNYTAEDFIKSLKSSNSSVSDLSKGFVNQKKVRNVDDVTIKQIDKVYEEYIKNCEFVLNDDTVLVLGKKFAKLYSKNLDPNDEYILRINKTEKSNIKVDKISFCFIDGKIQLLDFVVSGQDK